MNVHEREIRRREEMERAFACNLVAATLIAGRPELVSDLDGWFDCDWIVDDQIRDFALACLNQHENGEPTSTATLARDMGMFNPGWLARLIVDAGPICWHLRYYGEQVYECYRRRSTKLELEAAGGELDQGAEVDQVLIELHELHNRYAPRGPNRVPDNREVFNEIVDELDGRYRIGLETGLTDIDNMLGGIKPGSLVVVAADTSKGKSTFLGHIAANLSMVRGYTVLCFALEMSNTEMFKRWMRWHAQSNDKAKLAASLSAVKQHVDEGRLQLFCGSHTAKDIARQIKAFSGRHKVSAVFVDYVQILQANGNHETRERQVSEASATLKQAALDAGTVVFTASQVNSNDQLRESRAIGHDADVILKLEPSKADATVDVKCAKNRNGPTGIVQIVWRKEWYRYGDLEARHMPNYDPRFDQHNRGEL